MLRVIEAPYRLDSIATSARIDAVTATRWWSARSFSRAAASLVVSCSSECILPEKKVADCQSDRCKFEHPGRATAGTSGNRFGALSGGGFGGKLVPCLQGGIYEQLWKDRCKTVVKMFVLPPPSSLNISLKYLLLFIYYACPTPLSLVHPLKLGISYITL